MQRGVHVDCFPRPTPYAAMRTYPLLPCTAPRSLPMQFTGYLSVPGPGSWSFQLSSDDGSRLLLDGAVVIFNGGYHGDFAVSYTNPNLTAGLHSIQCVRGSVDSPFISHRSDQGLHYTTACLCCRVDFFQGGGAADVHLSWKSTDNGIADWQIIPTQYLSTPE